MVNRALNPLNWGGSKMSVRAVSWVCVWGGGEVSLDSLLSVQLVWNHLSRNFVSAFSQRRNRFPCDRVWNEKGEPGFKVTPRCAQNVPVRSDFAIRCSAVHVKCVCEAMRRQHCVVRPLYSLCFLSCNFRQKKESC